jgi:flagellar basal body rod protein FlgG
MGGSIQGKELSLTATKVVSTFVGSDISDNCSALYKFKNPFDITTDGTNLYVVDTNCHTIRQIVIDNGTATILAGTGDSGSANGVGTLASFNQPKGITTDGTNVYVADSFNHRIRQIGIDNRSVTTLAGRGYGTSDGVGTLARVRRPYGITTDGTNLYVADTNNHTIRQIGIDNRSVTTLAGTVGSPGSANGVGTAASFFFPMGITTDGTNLYVADKDNDLIRQIVISTGEVTTLAGRSSGGGSAIDDNGTAARFNNPAGITTDGIDLYVIEKSNHRLRKID